MHYFFTFLGTIADNLDSHDLLNQKAQHGGERKTSRLHLFQMSQVYDFFTF